MYAQEEVVPGTNGRVYAIIQCRNCHRFGHYLSHCPEASGQQNMYIEEEENEGDTKDEEAQNIQIEEIIRSEDYSSSDESYLVDFASFHFLQSEMVSLTHSTVSKEIIQESQKGSSPI